MPVNDDLISRSALKADLVESKDELWKIYRSITHEVDKQICAGQIASFQEVILRVKDAPAVDAVEVVFCDNCTSHNNCVAEGAYRLARIEKPFCCAGKRRSDDAD